MKTCPVCKAKYDDSWGICLKDSAMLVCDDDGKVRPSDLNLIANKKYQYLQIKMQSRLFVLVLLQIIHSFLYATPQMKMDPLVGALALAGLPIITGIFVLIWAVMLARSLRALGQEYKRYGQRVIHPNALLVGQLLISLSMGQIMFLQAATMALPLYLWIKGRRIGNIISGDLTIDMKPKNSYRVFVTIGLVALHLILGASAWLYLTLNPPSNNIRSYSLEDKNPYRRYMAYATNRPADLENITQEVRRLAENGNIEAAVRRAESVLNDSSYPPGRWLQSLTASSGDIIVKYLYEKGDLRGAILARKKSIAASLNSQFICNQIIELWDLQKHYRSQVGDAAYLNDIEVSEQQLAPDPYLEKMMMEYYDNLKKSRNIIDYHKAEFYSEYYFVRLNFERAEMECIRALELLSKIRKSSKNWGSDSFEFIIRERLMHAYVLQGKYESAIDLLANNEPKSDSGKRLYGATISTLQKAIDSKLSPSDLAYPWINPTKTDMGIYVKDTSFNRLDSSDSKDSVRVRVQHLD